MYKAITLKLSRRLWKRCHPQKFAIKNIFELSLINQFLLQNISIRPTLDIRPPCLTMPIPMRRLSVCLTLCSQNNCYKNRGVLYTSAFYNTKASPEHAHHNSMVSLVRLQCELLLWLQLVRLQLLDLTSKHLGRFRSRVNAISLRRKHGVLSQRNPERGGREFPKHLSHTTPTHYIAQS